MRRTSWIAALVAPCTVSMLAGCSSSGSSATDGGTAAPPAADLTAFSRLTNTIPVEVTVAGATGWGIVDTGDPWALLDPTTFPASAGLPDTGGTVPSVSLAGETADDPWVYGSASGDVELSPTSELDANLGFTVIGGFVASFNYRDVTFTLGTAATPSGLLAATKIPFTLAGGVPSDGPGVYPASRVVVTVSVEGTDYKMIVDTGATDVTLSAAAFKALTSDGRAQIAGDVATTSGTSTSSLTRAAKIAVGSVAVTDVVVSHDPSFDTHLTSVSMDAGVTIDGSLGGTFLREFFLTIDYPNTTLTFAPYADTSFTLDQGEVLGITLGLDGTDDYVVDTVTTAAAAKGVEVGDQVLAIGGTTLATASETVIETLLYGKVGSTELVKFGTAKKLTGMTIPILIEETLPLPASGG